MLGVYVQADWETMRDDEMRARNPVPQQVTMRQARLELLKRALLDKLEGRSEFTGQPSTDVFCGLRDTVI